MIVSNLWLPLLIGLFCLSLLHQTPSTLWLLSSQLVINPSPMLFSRTSTTWFLLYGLLSTLSGVCFVLDLNIYVFIKELWFREVRLGMSIVDIAAQPEINIPDKTLWNWFEQGTHLIHLCSGGNILFSCFSPLYSFFIGTFYMVLVLACLGLKTAFLSRNRTINYIVESLAFVLRVPDRKSLCHYFLLVSKYVIRCKQF